MTRAIAILSGKGGVGKSTVTANLAHALAELGEDVVALDSNLTTPHLGLHLGIHLVPNTVHDVLRGDTKIENSIYFHPSGFRVIPASMNVNDIIGVDPSKLTEVVVKMTGKCDILLLDAAPGLGREAVSSIQAADEILLVINPDLPSVADALKTLKIAEGLNKKVLGVVVNRVRGESHELNRKDIEDMLDLPILTEIPEDIRVNESMAIKNTLLSYKPDSPAAMQIKRLAHSLTGRDFEVKKSGAFGRFFKWAFG
jgi:septum site-determining protein MinD